MRQDNLGAVQASIGLDFGDRFSYVVGIKRDGEVLCEERIQTTRAAFDTFFSRFEAGGAHQNWMTPEELRLVAEWLDLGAQYYNDPFASAP